MYDGSRDRRSQIPRDLLVRPMAGHVPLVGGVKEIDTTPMEGAPVKTEAELPRWDQVQVANNLSGGRRSSSQKVDSNTPSRIRSTPQGHTKERNIRGR